MPKAKRKSVPEPIIPFTDFERSRLIVQLRCELLSDMAKAFDDAARSNLTPMDLQQRTMLFAIAQGYTLRSKTLKLTLDVVEGRVKP